MKNKAKLFCVNGADTQNIFDINAKKNYLISAEIIGKYTNLINIGSLGVGVSLDEIRDGIVSHLTEDDAEVNLIFNMHGSPVENGGYYKLGTKGKAVYPDKPAIKAFIEECERLGVSKQVIKEYKESALKVKYETVPSFASEIIAIIGEVAGQRPVKIFVISCYGENLLKSIDELPVGSMIITLSDKLCPTSSTDLANKFGSFVADYLFKDGFKIEKLLEYYALSQTHYQSTPKIAVKHDLLKHKFVLLDEYANETLTSEVGFSPLITQLLAFNNMTKAELLKLLNDSNNISELKCPVDLARRIFFAEVTKEVIKQVEDERESIEQELMDQSDHVDVLTVSNLFEKKSEYIKKIAFITNMLEVVCYDKIFRKYYPGLKFDLAKIDRKKFEEVSNSERFLLEATYELQVNTPLKEQIRIAIELAKLQVAIAQGEDISKDFFKFETLKLEFQNLKNQIKFRSFSESQPDCVFKNATPLKGLFAASNPSYEGKMPVYNMLLAMAADHMVRTDYLESVVHGDAGEEVYDYSS